MCARDMTAKSPRDREEEDVFVVAAEPTNPRDRDARLGQVLSGQIMLQRMTLQMSCMSCCVLTGLQSVLERTACEAARLGE